MPGSRALLVVAGEPSGDAMAAPVVSRLGVPSFGMGGPALRDAGLERLVDLSRVSAMGFGGVLARAPAIVRAGLCLLRAARQRRPRAALLVGYSEFNAWLGPRLRRLGIRVLWFSPPQIWAWRSARGPALRRACDRMALILPFEEPLWRALGADAHYVGHPAMEHAPEPRAVVRERIGLTPWAECIAVLPGSRPAEVSAHLVPMLDAVLALREERGALDARVILAPALPPRSARWAAEVARAKGVPLLSGWPAAEALPAFNIALASSGTVTLESALAGVPPVIVYRTGKSGAFIARRLVSVESIGLPNIVLGERAFVELLQDAVTAEAMAHEARRLLDAGDQACVPCRRVRETLQAALELGPAPVPGDGPSARVARLLAPWLD